MLDPFPLSLSTPELQVWCHTGPKDHNSGKRIDNFSSSCVNNGVDCDLCSLFYISVDNVAVIMHRLGKGSLLCKIDKESVYRLIPMHKSEHPLQAVS